MSKAVLVMDMPSSCDECPLFGSHYSDMTCKANGRSINYPYPKDERQDYCPLRNLPEKKVLSGDVADIQKMGKELMDIGYNACIDEISKGGE